MPDDSRANAASADGFGPTDWSLVVAAAQDQRGGPALNRLCRKYWRPVYVHVRGNGFAKAEAEDATQEFFLNLLEAERIKKANQEKGSFRGFLYQHLVYFLCNHRRVARAQKRGGQAPHFPLDAESCEAEIITLAAEGLDPAKSYDRVWANTLIDAVMARLREEYATAGASDLFASLKPFILRSPDYSKLETELGLGRRVLVKRVESLRKRYSELIRAEVAQTVMDRSRSNVDQEMQHLLAALAA